MDEEKGRQESDRNARAYGFEIGRGKPLAETLTEISTDNPFNDPQWASKMNEWNEHHVREDGLVAHAKKELARLGNDKDFDECIIGAVRSFARYGHSGGSAGVGIHILHDLLQFKNVSPLTNDPSEWNQVSGDCWQSSRCSEAFSNDQGETHWLLSEGATQDDPWPRHASMIVYKEEKEDGST